MSILRPSRTGMLYAVLACISFLTLQHPTVLAQGILTPPGAPAPTMKTLAQIEPRIPIASLPFTINLGGSYYVTTNLTGVFNTNGITINADGVTLDLNGFELASGGGNSGVLVADGVRGVCVRNGSMSGWSTAVSAFNCVNCRFENLRMLDNSGTISAGSNCVIAMCMLQDNNTGLFAYGGSRIQDCVVAGTSGVGINTTDASTIQNCIVRQSLTTGIFLGNDCTVSDCVVQTNGGTGIYAADRSSIRNCSVSWNFGYGIQVGVDSVIKNCTSIGNFVDGINGDDRCMVEQCNVSQNGQSGIHQG